MKIFGDNVGPPVVIILETKKEMEILKLILNEYFSMSYSPGAILNSLKARGLIGKIYDFLAWRLEA